MHFNYISYKHKLLIYNKCPVELTFNDSQVADFLEELGAFLQGHLAMIDAVSRNYSYNRILWNSGVTLYVEMKG